jgi:hypothetical protein
LQGEGTMERGLARHDATAGGGYKGGIKGTPAWPTTKSRSGAARRSRR